MIAALRGAIVEIVQREEEAIEMFERLAGEVKDQVLRDFFQSLAEDSKIDLEKVKNINLQTVMKFGKMHMVFRVPQIEITEDFVRKIADTSAAKEALSVSVDTLNANIEYYEHIATHSIFNESKHLCRLVADKEIERKSKLKALFDMLE